MYIIKRTHGERAHAHTQNGHADTETDRQAGRQREAERDRKRELRNGRESEEERLLSCGEVERTTASRGLSGVKCASACAFMNLNTVVQPELGLEFNPRDRALACDALRCGALSGALDVATFASSGTPSVVPRPASIARAMASAGHARAARKSSMIC